MKICWDNLDGFILGKRNGELRKGNYTYIEMDKCLNCGDPYLMNKANPTDYCCISCGKHGSDYVHNEATKLKIGKAAIGNKYMLGKKHSLKTKKKLSKITSNKTGKDASAWKGGVTEKNIPLYSTYAEKLAWVDDVYLIKKDALELLGVSCTKCGKVFVPKLTDVHSRLKYLKGQINPEGRFYCSDLCKHNCELYNQKIWPRNNKPRVITEFNGFDEGDLKVWSKEVLKRANYKCEYCGKQAEHAHHIRPKKLDPGFALDPDNGLACCKNCHYKYGHRDDCSTWSLSRVVCD